MRRNWTKEEVNLLIENYNILTNEKLMKLFNRSYLSIYKKARCLGLYKCEKMKFKNKSIARTAEKASNWKGGRKKTDKGYILRYKPDHHRASKNNKYIFEHILIMENYLGRPIGTDEVVHHKNGIKDDNRVENLEVMEFGEHSAMHNRMRKREVM